MGVRQRLEPDARVENRPFGRGHFNRKQATFIVRNVRRHDAFDGVGRIERCA